MWHLSKLLIAAAAILPRLYAQTTPDTAEQTAILERARAAALEYGARLQNFTCTRTVRRTADESGKGDHYKLLETQEGDLSYVDHKEHYQVLKVNGKTTKLDKRVTKGYFTPGGEFGSTLARVFEPKAAAVFTFDHVQTSGDRATCSFRYDVPQATTTMMLKANNDKYPLGHHGVVDVDCETGATAHVHVESEVRTVVFQGREIEIGHDLDVRYALTAIGDKQYLLPQEALEINRFGKRLTKAEIQFTRYRKYDASSAISFGADKQP
jgi:hypothetical protein